MINSKQQDRLLSNWEHRETLTTNAEVRIYDPLSKWECYLVAMNPQCTEEVYVILNGAYPSTAEWTLTEIMQCYNSLGDHPFVDPYFQPTNAGDLFKKLKDKKDGLHGYKRDEN